MVPNLQTALIWNVKLRKLKGNVRVTWNDFESQGETQEAVQRSPTNAVQNYC